MAPSLANPRGKLPAKTWLELRKTHHKSIQAGQFRSASSAYLLVRSAAGPPFDKTVSSYLGNWNDIDKPPGFNTAFVTTMFNQRGATLSAVESTETCQSRLHQATSQPWPWHRCHWLTSSSLAPFVKCDRMPPGASQNPGRSTLHCKNKQTECKLLSLQAPTLQH